MRNRAIMLTLSVDEQREVYIGGATKLAGKIDFLLDNPRVKFIDFGTRRRFSGPWQRFILESLIAELPPEQFLGTSNVKLGIELGIDISGTNAHEEPMVIAAIMDDDIKAAQHYFLRTWYEEYGPDFAIFLPDTFTTEYALSILTREEAELYRGMRQDSGCPKADGDKKIAFYESMEIDPMTKIHLMSDGLTHERMAEYADYFEGRILVGFGWGTNLTCDMGLPELFVSMSIVIKAVMANGIATVKLSDNIAKAICIVLARIELYKRLVGYHVTFDKKCEV